MTFLHDLGLCNASTQRSLSWMLRTLIVVMLLKYKDVTPAHHPLASTAIGQVLIWAYRLAKGDSESAAERKANPLSFEKSSCRRVC